MRDKFIDLCVIITLIFFCIGCYWVGYNEGKDYMAEECSRKFDKTSNQKGTPQDLINDFSKIYR